MSIHSPLVRRMFRITVDIETTIGSESHDLTSRLPDSLRYQQALVQGLLARPEVLLQFLRSVAVDALNPANKLVEAEYGWGRASDQQLLQPIIAELDPAAQDYFTEEVEEGVRGFYVECYEATVKRFGMIELDE
jgi:hypothetical protein